MSTVRRDRLRQRAATVAATALFPAMFLGVQAQLNDGAPAHGPFPADARSTFQVAPSRTYDRFPAMLKLAVETLEGALGPGVKINVFGGERLKDLRDGVDRKFPGAGVTRDSAGNVEIINVPNPDAVDGRWDPYQYMPRFAFDPREDAYPVSPAFDGDADLSNNGPKSANAPDAHYASGIIGGTQPLQGAFSVTKKGPFTVLTYSFYLAHNKAGTYHANDYSTTQVYLAPGSDGRLAPQQLFTSFHHGGVLTPWADLEKDAAGRPTVKVLLGSHALTPVEDGHSPPRSGLQIEGDGSVAYAGRPLPYRLKLEAFQTNVDNVIRLEPDSIEGRTRLTSLSWGDAAMNPLLPRELEGEDPWHELQGKAQVELARRVRLFTEDAFD